jgi:hypothetical protein
LNLLNVFVNPFISNSSYKKIRPSELLALQHSL